MGGAGGTASSHVHNHSRLLHITDCLHQQKGTTLVHRVEFFFATRVKYRVGVRGVFQSTRDTTPSNEHRLHQNAQPPASKIGSGRATKPSPHRYRLREAGAQSPAPQTGRGRSKRRAPSNQDWERQSNRGQAPSNKDWGRQRREGPAPSNQDWERQSHKGQAPGNKDWKRQSHEGRAPSIQDWERRVRKTRIRG